MRFFRHVTTLPTRIGRLTTACVIGIFIVVAWPSSGVAQAADGNEWRFELTPYFWLAQLDGDVTVKGFDATLDQDLGDAWDLLVDNFNIGGAVHLEAHNGQWGVFGDLLYMSLESEAQGPIIGQDIDAEFEQFVGELGGFYRLVGAEPGDRRRRPKLDILAGVRITDLSIEVDPELGQTRDASQTWVDPFIGARGEVRAFDRTTVFARADFGGFGIDEGTTSDFVWNVEAGLRFDFSDHGSISAGYRWLGTDFEDDDDAFQYDVVASGPFFSFTLRW